MIIRCSLYFSIRLVALPCLSCLSASPLWCHPPRNWSLSGLTRGPKQCLTHFGVLPIRLATCHFAPWALSHQLSLHTSRGLASGDCPPSFLSHGFAYVGLGHPRASTIPVRPLWTWHPQYCPPGAWPPSGLIPQASPSSLLPTGLTTYAFPSMFASWGLVPALAASGALPTRLHPIVLALYGLGPQRFDLLPSVCLIVSLSSLSAEIVLPSIGWPANCMFCHVVTWEQLIGFSWSLEWSLCH
jgi:hypothetical protein